ncbi:MAG: chloride channel protein [Hyphomicrobiaceae bacterium]
MTDHADTQPQEGHVLLRIVALAVLALVLGTIASLGAIAFVECVRLINDALFISPRSRVLYERTPWLIAAATILVPALGGLLVGVILRRTSDEQRPLGPADAIGAVQTRRPLPSLRAGLASTVAAVISLGCGASVGQYGPMVYLGALAGGLATRLKIPVRNLQAIAIACGVAAAISTAFNAPIAGLVFAHEVILRHYSIQAFAPTTVASATGYVIANVIFGRPPLFLVAFDGVGHSHEFLLFALIGVLAALLAVAYMRCILAFTTAAARSPLPPELRPALAGLVVGLVALALPDVMGIGKETLRFATIEGAFEAWELGLIVVAKIVLTALCIGFGFAGGVFSPALLIGVLFGALCWTSIDALTTVPNSGIVVYAICGMMALTSPVIGAPLTTILIVFELTRSYDLTIAAMVSVVFANLIAYRIFARSLFDVQLVRRGIDLSNGRDQALLASGKVSDLASREFVHCTSKEAVSIVLDRLSTAGRAEAVVLDTDGKYLGIARAQDARGSEDRPVSAIAKRGTVTFDENTTLWQAMLAIEGFIGDAVPVVSSKSGRLIGMVAEGDLIGAYLTTVHDLRREENETV